MKNPIFSFRKQANDHRLLLTCVHSTLRHIVLVVRNAPRAPALLHCAVHASVPLLPTLISTLRAHAFAWLFRLYPLNRVACGQRLVRTDNFEILFEVQDPPHLLSVEPAHARSWADFEFEALRVVIRLRALDPLHRDAAITFVFEDLHKQWYTGIERCDVMPWGLKTLNLS